MVKYYYYQMIKKIMSKIKIYKKLYQNQFNNKTNKTHKFKNLMN